jgi:hypothetical protein
MMFQTERLAEAKPPNRSLIVFHRYGDSYFLSEILTAGQQVGGSELFPSRAERQLKRENNQTASNKIEPETVALAVLLTYRVLFRWSAMRRVLQYVSYSHVASGHDNQYFGLLTLDGWPVFPGD